MAWERVNNELKLIGARHYDPDEIRDLISQLRQTHAKAESVIRLLGNMLDTGRVSKPLIFQFSKWCDWNHPSERIARLIAARLFYDNICRRLRGQANEPIPDRPTAEADYQDWMERVARVSQELQADTVFPGDTDQVKTYIEGAVVKRVVNAYERDNEARKKCLEHYGTRCYICNFDFGRAYDGIGTGYIHVHHLRPLSQIRESYVVDAIADLRPVCPNCHLVIHIYRKPFRIEDVKAMVARARELNPDGPFK